MIHAPLQVFFFSKSYLCVYRAKHVQKKVITRNEGNLEKSATSDEAYLSQFYIYLLKSLADLQQGTSRLYQVQCTLSQMSDGAMMRSPIRPSLVYQNGTLLVRGRAISKLHYYQMSTDNFIELEILQSTCIRRSGFTHGTSMHPIAIP